MDLHTAIETFDIDDPELPRIVRDEMMTAGDYPYPEKMDRDLYEKRLHALHLELAKLQRHLARSGERMVLVFEGRDAAGKGGAIKRYTKYLNPRHTRVVALPKPSDREQGEWYFQRYTAHLPTSGEAVLFDRSWYNRAGVERVMGFCTGQEVEKFLAEAPRFEDMLVNDGIRLCKFWLNISRPMQLKRFHDRRHDPLKDWKLSPIDLKALSLWDAYTAARDDMLRATHTDHAPWTVVRANDKRRARLSVIATALATMNYPGKHEKLVAETDPEIVMPASRFLERFALGE